MSQFPSSEPISQPNPGANSAYSQPPLVESPPVVFEDVSHHGAAAPAVQMQSAPIPRKVPFQFFRTLAFAVVVAGLSVFFLFVDFQGLSTAEGMEQADVARSIARGEGMTTQFLRPVLLAYQVKESGSPEIPMKLRTTSQGLLNSWVNAALLKISGTDYAVDFRYRIYFPDRVIAAGSVLFFLGSMGLLYLLVSRLFDVVLAGFTVAGMLVCEMMWRFTQSGLPHMLGLFLFMAALCCLARALELWRVGRVPLIALLGSALFFGLLVLVSPMGLGVGVAGAFFVGLVFKKKILLPILFGLVFVLIVSPWMIRSHSISGSLLGIGSMEIQDSWGESAGSPIMRNYEPGGESAFPRFFLAKKMGRVLSQHFSNFFLLIGGSVGAALFAISLLHPFRNPNAVLMRNGLALMWLGAMLMMMLYGTPDLLMDANQVHVWFVPLATAFGFAVLSVFWARLPIAHGRWSLWKWAHLVAAVAVMALPMAVDLPGRAMLGFRQSNRVVHWPPYDPAAMSMVKEWTEEHQVIFSDIPWAMAWYGDRSSIWLPENPTQFETLAKQIESQTDAGVAGVFLTPQTLDLPLASGVIAGDFAPWNRILLAGPMKAMGIDVFDRMPSAMTYGKRLSASRNQESWFFSPRPIGQ